MRQHFARLVRLTFLAVLAVPSHAATAEPEASSRQTPVVDQASDQRPTARQAVTKFFEAERLAAAGDKRGARLALEVVASAKRGFYPGPQSPLSEFRDDPELSEILTQLRLDFPRTENGRIAYRLDGSNLLPEGIAYDPASERLFLSDWRQKTIYELPANGKPKAFFTVTDLTPNGMAVDAKRNALWAVATNAFRGAKQPRSELLRIDLQTKAKQSFLAGEAKGFNDVAVAPNGDVYVSDTPGHRIFRLRSGSDQLEELLGPDSGLRSPNGLTVDSSGTYLFVAQGMTPFRIRLSDGDLSLLELPPDLIMVGTDGFYFRDGSLYAIQNLTTPGRVLRLQLNESMDKVAGYDVLDSGNPAFDLPTTGAIVENRLLVLANAQLYKIAKEGRAAPKDVKPPIILSYDLGS